MDIWRSYPEEDAAERDAMTALKLRTGILGRTGKDFYLI
jgi:hypothetical protein